MKKLPVWIERQGGLPFACTQCGDCCRGVDGYVWVAAHEIERLAGFLELGVEAFTRRYVRRVDGELALVDRPGERGDCVFWEDGRGCAVYAARPDQCRTFPFWPENLASPDDWAWVARECPGVRAAARPGSGARVYAPAEILALASGRGEAAESPPPPPGRPGRPRREDAR